MTLMQVLTQNEFAPLPRGNVFNGQACDEPDIKESSPHEEVESEVTVTEPPTSMMLQTTHAGSNNYHLIPEEIVESSPIESVGEIDYAWNGCRAFQPELEDVRVKIVYPNEAMKKQLTLAEFKHLDLLYEESHLEAARARLVMCQTDAEYSQWHQGWVEHRLKALEFFKKSKSQTWKHFKSNYSAMKQGKKPR